MEIPKYCRGIPTTAMNDTVAFLFKYTNLIDTKMCLTKLRQ